MSWVNAVYQKICCAIAPCAGTGPDSEKVMPWACGGAYFFIQSRYFAIEKTAPGPVVLPPRLTGEPTRRQAPLGVPPSSTGRALGGALWPLSPLHNHTSGERPPPA